MISIFRGILLICSLSFSLPHITVGFQILNSSCTISKSYSLSLFSVIKCHQYSLTENKQLNFVEVLNEINKKMKSSKVTLSIRYQNYTTIRLVGAVYISNIYEIALQYNNIVSLEERTFAYFGNLTKLSLEHNKLQRLNKRDLDGLYRLEILLLNSNQISELSQGVFCSLVKLKLIDLSFNKLIFLRDHLFSCKNSALRILSVRSNQIATLEAHAFDGLSALEHIDLSANDLTTLDPTLFATLSALFFVNLSDNRLGSTNVSLAHHSTLNTVLMTHNRLQHVRRGMFVNLTTLSILCLGPNNISRIESGTFSSIPNLLELRLFDNRLTAQQLASDCTFHNSSLTRLQTLTLHMNELGSFGTPPLFLHLTSLDHLILSSNKIRHLEPAALRGLVSLKRLDMKNNELASLDGRVFDGLAVLEELRLSRNNISALLSLFARIRSVKWLRLERNRITELSTLAHLSADVKPTDAACDLNLTLNWIETVPTRSFQGIALATLSLNRNRIGKLEPSAFDGTIGMQILLLARNRISDLWPNQWRGLDSLTKLDLRHNLIEYLATGCFNAVHSLQHLLLDGNRIRFIERFFAGLFSADQMLFELSLADNRLGETDRADLRALPCLSRLSLSGNMLDDASLVWHNAAHLSGLMCFELARNRIGSLCHEQSFQLETIDLSSNPLRFEQFDCRGNATSLLRRARKLRLVNVTDRRLPMRAADWLHAVTATSLLEELDLSDNGAIELFDESTLNTSSFDLQKLKRLVLSGNQIIERVAAVNAGNSNVMSLSVLEQFLDRIGDQLKELAITDNDLGRFNRRLIAQRWNSSLISLTLRNASLTSLDQLTPELRKLENLDLSHNRLSVVLRDHLPTNNLRVLILAHNLLRLFEPSLPKIIDVNLRANQLVDLSTLEFRNCPKHLTSLDLSHNSITRATHFPIDVNLLRNLLRLNYSHNRIRVIGRGLCPIASNLELLDLSANEIEQIEENALLAPTLISLRLGHNRLRSLRRFFFEHLYGLEMLSVAYNLVEFIEPQTFGKLTKLAKLDLNNNALKMLNGQVFANLASLRFLKLTGMPQMHLNERSFETIRQTVKDIHLDASMFRNETVVCLTRRWLWRLRADRQFRTYYDTIYLITEQGAALFDAEEQRERQFLCDLVLFYLRHNVDFNIKSEINFEHFFKTCRLFLRPQFQIKCKQ